MVCGGLSDHWGDHGRPGCKGPPSGSTDKWLAFRRLSGSASGHRGGSRSPLGGSRCHINGRFERF